MFGLNSYIVDELLYYYACSNTDQTDVVHQLVQVLIPQVSILILKVLPHSQHDIVGTIITSL